MTQPVPAAEQSDKVTILCVDDDAILAGRIRKRLERQGFEVTLAGDGATGLDLAERQRFDLIIVDHFMPVMGGLEMIRRLRERDDSVLIIMMTGAGDENVAVESLKLGASDYLVKDGHGQYLEMLPMIISQALNRQQLREEKEHAEKLLRISEERYRLLFSHMIDGLALLEKSFPGGCRHCGYQFLEINNSFRRLLALYAVTLKGECGCVLPPEMRDFLGEAFREVVASGQVFRGEVPVTTLDRFFQVIGYRPKKDQVAIMIRDETARRKAEVELELLATTDELTTLFNRRKFFNMAERELGRIQRYGGSASLIMLDMDHFKLVNDRFGHTAGDLTLKAIGEKIRNTLRQADLAGRYGGEEFIILLPETGPREAFLVAERLRQGIEATQVCTSTGTVAVTVSCGVASCGTGRAFTLESILNEADQALYRAKNDGRNRTRISEPENGR